MNDELIQSNVLLKEKKENSVCQLNRNWDCIQLDVTPMTLMEYIWTSPFQELFRQLWRCLRIFFYKSIKVLLLVLVLKLNDSIQQNQSPVCLRCKPRSCLGTKQTSKHSKQNTNSRIFLLSYNVRNITII